MVEPLSCAGQLPILTPCLGYCMQHLGVLTGFSCMQHISGRGLNTYTALYVQYEGIALTHMIAACLDTLPCMLNLNHAVTSRDCSITKIASQYCRANMAGGAPAATSASQSLSRSCTAFAWHFPKVHVQSIFQICVGCSDAGSQHSCSDVDSQHSCSDVDSQHSCSDVDSQHSCSVHLLVNTALHDT